MCALYWSIARLGMFVRLRLFALFSALLLDNQSSGRLRAGLLRLNGARVGKNCFVRGKLLLLEGFDLTLGDDVFINSGCCLDFAAPIRIGNRVQISFQVSLITGDHHIGGHEQRAGRVCPRSIVIEDGAWIGARATILPGVRIGAGAIVGAGALVTKDVAPDTLVIGVPASVHRELSAEGDADS
jgi:acetyltransferase-like isoleucine patch superfamily enzyme